MTDVAHGKDTKLNESLNSTIAWMAPKNKTLSESRSLQGSVCLALGIQLISFRPHMTELLNRLGIALTPGTKAHLARVHREKETKHERRASLKCKRKRAEKQKASPRDSIKEAELKRCKNGFCSPWEGFNTCVHVDLLVLPVEAHHTKTRVPKLVHSPSLV